METEYSWGRDDAEKRLKEWLMKLAETGVAPSVNKFGEELLSVEERFLCSGLAAAIDSGSWRRD